MQTPREQRKLCACRFKPDMYLLLEETEGT